MFCNHCGNPIPHNAEFCPECGRPCRGNSGGYSAYSGSREKRKKPVYQKLWFWLLMLLFSPVLYVILINLITFIISFVDAFTREMSAVL